MHILDRLPRETGREYALRTIKENIINLELAPGSQISENELSAEMGLSRTPVREALIELSKVKIVEIHPQKRSVVSLIDYDLVEESRFMRHLLECAVVQLDCEMASPEDIKRLQENVQLQNFYLDNFYTEQLLPLDNAFHGILFDIARKSQIFSLMSNISIHFDRVRSMALSSVKNLKIVQDHENIVSAIARRDAAQARDLMEQHLSRYKIDAAAIREKYPQYFV
ncbi:GntR family transcriptional regulator [uncultured Oscillibacter sp.]|uniref:GntR family transcriptional regulator n=1 Tax=uncultured Oscillibacter sp. TaxID=876091 RepID=UPI0025E1ADBF|nr:GntR family transcriptional regulator [uncultured Oscillibacter sp.]